MSDELPWKPSGSMALVRLSIEFHASAGIPMGVDALLRTAAILKACEEEVSRLEQRIHTAVAVADHPPSNVVNLGLWIAARLNEKKEL